MFNTLIILFIVLVLLMSQVYTDPTAKIETNIKFQDVLLLACPLVALIGNAASDIWVCLIGIVFIIHSYTTRNWIWTEAIWFRLTVVFWVWLVLVSIISQWPENALRQALPWIRFPIFAAAIVTWVGDNKQLYQRMAYALCAGVLIMGAFLLYERLSDPTLVRLYGTWTQHPKPGWYMLGIGLPAMLWALAQIKEKQTPIIGYALLILFIFGSTISTGEIYINISMIFCCLLFITMMRWWSWQTCLILAIGGSIAALIIMSNPDMLYRFTKQILIRLPWLPTSDYYDPWIGGLNTGVINHYFGIGADNYEIYCKQLLEQGQLYILNVKNCASHPHNLYIQTFSETGILGLLTFCAVAVTLLREPLKQFNFYKPCILSMAALAILIMVFWPISTYSQAFGQHKNMFTWFLIGWALTLAHMGKQKSK